ncbi:MAG: hypothetical protein HN348_22190 [Proteobacteria bacterium]|jgi:hypothetical protein|nr:hypothetical protein [Pseudomonadota bacterium]
MKPFAYSRHHDLLELVKPHLIPGEMAHDEYHLLRVYAWAVRLAPEAGASADLSGAAASVALRPRIRPRGQKSPTW